MLEMLNLSIDFSLHIVKIVVTLVAIFSYLYFHKEWKKVKHSTSLFSFYTTSKIFKMSKFVVTGLILFFVSFVLEMTFVLFNPIVHLLQILGIVSIGYVLFMLFRSEMPKPVRKVVIEDIKFETLKPKGSVYEKFKSLESKKEKTKKIKPKRKRTIKTKTKKMTYQQFMSKYRSKGWSMTKISKEWKKYKK